MFLPAEQAQVNSYKQLFVILFLWGKSCKKRSKLHFGQTLVIEVTLWPLRSFEATLEAVYGLRGQRDTLL